MGRVKRYKKLKSCDPFYRGSRKVDKGMDLPPSKRNDQSSNSFRYFLEATKGSPKDENPTKKESSEITLTRKTKKRARKKPLKVNADNEEETKEDEPVFKRLKGESNSHFLARVEVESSQRLLDAQRKAHKKSDRRKHYNKQRKIKYQLRKLGVNLEDAEGMDFKDLRDHISFGEVAQQPPNFSTKSKRAVQKKPDLLLSKLNLKQKLETEIERERVINLYRHNKTRTIHNE